MASDVDMSLEEIIKNKKKAPQRKAGPRPKLNQRLNIAQGKPAVARLGDARNKIISKRRTQIADLRDKLAEISLQRDVRDKLDHMRMRKSGVRLSNARTVAYNNIQENRRQLRNAATNLHRGFIDLSRQVSARPLPALPKFNIHRQASYHTATTKRSSMHSDRILPGYKAPRKPILRTVENDVYLPNVIEIDDEYEPPPRVPGLPRVSSVSRVRSDKLNFKITRDNDQVQLISSVPRKQERCEERMPPSILKKRPMAALRMDRETTRRRTSPPPVPISPPASPPAAARRAPEYRIVVSNLRSSVTGTDIQELFGDVGGLVESRLVRPGTAEVIYGSLEDAQSAVDLYHNRQLDGQPMNCLLVNPRSQSVVSSGRLGASKLPTAQPGASSVVPDLDTFHKVLFSRS